MNRLRTGPGVRAEVSRRWAVGLLAAVALVGAVLVARAASADPSGCASEASGDAADPRGDLVTMCVTYDGGTLTVSSTPAQPTDPTVDPVWEGFTEASWELDVSGDGVGDLTLVFARYGGAVQSGVLDAAGNLRCTGSTGWDGTNVGASVPATCLGDPAPAAVGVAAVWTLDPDATDPDATESVDRLPDVGLAGVFGPDAPPPPEPTPSQDPQPTPTACAPTPPAAPGAPGVERVAGDSRVRTAIALSRDTWPGCADAVVLARADAYPDALAGAPLAVARGGPLLLTGSDRLDPDTRAELERLDPAVVILLGGEQALGDGVADDVAALDGPQVERIAGSSRFDTAALIAAELGPTSTAIVVEGGDPDPGRGWPDAVSAAAYAAAQGLPVLLTDTADLPGATADALDGVGAASVIVVGGEAAVSADVADALRDGGRDVRRVAGATRYGTSVAVAAEAVEAGSDPLRTYFATGLDYPDALTAGAAAGALAAPLVLVDGDDAAASPETVGWIDQYGGDWTRATLVGGPAAVSERTADIVAGAR